MTDSLATRAGVELLLIAAAVPAVALTAYLALLALCSRRRRIPAPSRDTRFAILVPAHDEAFGIAATVHSLLALDYPAERRQVIVIADNCTDRTAEIAREAGATVLERHDATRKGKGYALAMGFAECLRDASIDAVVVVDADSVVTPNLLTAFAGRLAQGARCLQAEYGVRNPDASRRTRLMRIAFATYHTLRSLGRARLGLSCGLRGNGMAFTREVLERVPYRAFSLVEDVEYGIDLGLAGIVVEYVPEASVLGDMPTTGEASRSQRERWERGRAQLWRSRALPLLRASIGTRGRIALDLLADILVPPLTRIVAGVAGGTCVAMGLWALRLSPLWAVIPWMAASTFLLLYVVRGVGLSGVGWRGVADMAYAPVYAAWKLSLVVYPRRRDEWTRTQRLHEDGTR